MKNTKWLKTFFISAIIILLLSAILIYIIDPFFHYHKPLQEISYIIEDERLQNDGILKNFDYNAIITGTSHTENFKTSEFDKLFSVNSVKVSLSAGQFKEIAEQLRRSIMYNDNIKFILYGITYEDILSDKNSVSEHEIPEYLYDDNLLNDYKYLLNITALKMAFNDLWKTIKNEETTNFDDYAKWYDKKEIIFSKENVLKNYIRKKDKNISESLTDYEIIDVKENIEQNITSIVSENNNINFYIFLSPHSIVGWDRTNREGKTLKYLEAEEILINELLKYDNVKLYSFFNNPELICDLNNYTDIVHYSEKINSKILNWMKNDEYLITENNKEEYLEQERDFYLNYNYDEIFLNT